MKKILIVGEENTLALVKMLAEQHKIIPNLVFAQAEDTPELEVSVFKSSPLLPPSSWLNPPKIKLTEEFEKPKSKYHK